MKKCFIMSTLHPSIHPAVSVSDAYYLLPTYLLQGNEKRERERERERNSELWSFWPFFFLFFIYFSFFPFITQCEEKALEIHSRKIPFVFPPPRRMFQKVLEGSSIYSFQASKDATPQGEGGLSQISQTQQLFIVIKADFFLL